MTRSAVDKSAETFKELLKSYRIRADLTQEELSEVSGVSVRAISDMERGIAKSPQRRTIESLAPPLALTDEELAHLQKVAKRARSRAIPAATPEPVAAPEPGEPVDSRPSPLVLGMLPPDVSDFTGREGALDALTVLVGELKRADRRSGGFVLLSGPPGTGKTTLAVRAAHDLSAHFPDGVLFLRLRGMSEPNEPADVLHLLLRSLGLNAVHIPADMDQRTALCRSLLQDRRALIVLDDVADEAQVRPLLVGGPHCLSLITSRHLLVGIGGVQRVDLDVLDRDDATALLSSIVGPERAAREPEATGELVDLCGRLPLAIRIAGNRLASRPVWPLSHLVGQLRDRNRRLAALAAGDLDVRSVFDLSYRQLSPNARTVFRRLSLVQAADFSASAAMALVDAPEEDDAAILLEELADASLLQPTPDYGRYQFHDLLKVFAAELLVEEETAEAAAAAEDRLTLWLVRTATAAGRYFIPTDGMTPPPAATPLFDDHTGAARWLEAEAQNWLAAVRNRVARGDYQQVLDLAKVMHWYSELGGTASTWELLELAVQSAVATGNKFDEAMHRNYLAWVRSSRMDHQADDALVLAHKAVEAAVAIGDTTGHGWARVHLANAQRITASPAEYLESLAQAVALFEQDDYRLGVHIARFIRADYLHHAGRLEEAGAEFDVCVRYFRQPYGRARNPSDDINYANLLLHSSLNLAALSQLEEALDQCHEALELFRRHRATMGQARTLQASGKFLWQKGERRDAHGRLSSALALFERAGLPRSQVDTLRDMAALSDELGDPVSARDERGRALMLCDRLDRAEAAQLRQELTDQLAAS